MSTSTMKHPGTGPVDLLVGPQREPTAVETFARRHASPGHDASTDGTRVYRDLIPAAAPGEGQQYAFEVDLDACSGCKACVSACHSLNGLDDDETWRDVGMLVGGTTALPVIQHVTTACHHCLEPACMHGCPVLAYEKDPATGIVRHLDDQCIGCQYCVLKCPYDVPKYNPKRGIVRKCDMCSSRLAVSEAPACAAACPNGAIRIRIADSSQVARDVEADDFLPGAPGPEYTLPTTHYKTRRPLPRNLLAADHYRIAPEHAHLPLVFMLVLTQLSVGAFVVGQVLAWAADGKVVAALRPLHAAGALAVAVIALAASVLHLGRPLYAFRAVLGLRTSWLSREIVAFGAFAALASAFAACCWAWRGGGGGAALNALGAAVCVAGLIAVVCSVMVYHDTRRAFWRGPFTAVNFGLTTLLLGTAALFMSALSAAALHPSLPLLELARGWGRTACAWLATLAGLKLLLGFAPLLHLRDRRHTPMRRTARLLGGPLLRPMIARTVLTLVGGILLPLLAMAGVGHHATALPGSPADFAILVVAAFLMLLAGELVARYLFFTAVVAPRMPGGLGA